METGPRFIRRAGEARDRTCDPLVYKASDITTAPYHVFGYLSLVSDRAPTDLSFTRFNLAVKSMKILKEYVYKHYTSFQKKEISETNILTPHLLKSVKWF